MVVVSNENHSPDMKVWVCLAIFGGVIADRNPSDFLARYPGQDDYISMYFHFVCIQYTCVSSKIYCEHIFPYQLFKLGTPDTISDWVRYVQKPFKWF